MPTTWRGLFSVVKPYEIFLHLAVVALTVEVILLAMENRDLKSMGPGMPIERIKVGDHFSLGNLEALLGTSVVDTSSESLIFVFTTTCPYCKNSVPYWRDLAAIAKRRQLTVFGVSVDDRRKTLDFIDSSFVYPVLIASDAKSYRTRNRIAGVPQTILRGSNGRVKAIWPVGLDETKFREVAEAISGTNITHNHERIQ